MRIWIIGVVRMQGRGEGDSKLVCGIKFFTSAKV